MKQEEYFIGLDMGTNSVGWAVTDNRYNLLRAKGKDMWGIREFAEAMPAANRRPYRISRRNRQRKQVNIGLLKDYLHDAVMQEDPSFFIRLEDSFLHEEDKDESLNTDDALFADKDYSDAEYFAEYPTIFHLKYALIQDVVPFDNRYTRKLFLALLNYFKRRGHFLNNCLSVDSEGTTDIWTAFVELCESLSEEMDFSINYAAVTEGEFKSVFTETGVSRSRRREKLMELFSVQKKNQKEFLILTAICGLKTDLLKLLGIESEQKADLDFSDINFDEKLPDIYSVIGTEYEWLIESLKSVYDAGVLSSIMVGVNWLSEARIRDYEKHKQDLRLLKKVIRRYCTQAEYDFMFREETEGSYSAYIGTFNANKKIRRGDILHKTKSSERYDKLKKRIKEDLNKHSMDPDVAYIFAELDAETFLPKQLTFANGVIPNQLHAREMKKILDNASKYLPFLNEKDESGLTTAERILRLFTFQIPFYIGPVSQNYKGNGWAIRNPGMEKERVLPWNIKDVINYEETNEAFIMRMVRKCSYISGESALPKESLMYQRYMVLNVINSLKIHNEKISVELKQDIYHDLFESGKKVTKSGITKYLKNRGLIDGEEDISGVDNEIGCQLSTYHRFYAVLGDDIKKDSVKQMIEQIVFWGTVYGDSKSMLRNQIEKKYGDVLPKAQIKRIVGFRFRDWGRLSREFLELNACNKDTGEITSLLRALWEDEDNLNLMELLHSGKYSFEDALKEKTEEDIKTLSEFTFEDLEGMYFSAPVKRMIWQTLSIIKEIEQIKGYPAAKIFVEMTRTEDDKKGDAGRKDSREKALLGLYKDIKGDRDWKKEIEEAGKSGKLKSKKLYLYYMQMGKDAYTGLPIDLADLFDDNKYDIDHIFPRHYVKDDSIHNNLNQIVTL